MRQECIDAVVSAAKAAGRELTAQDLRDIESRLRKTISYQWQTNRAVFEKLSPGERLKQAAKAAAADVMEDKARRARNVADTIVKEKAHMDYVANYGKNGRSHMEGVSKLLVNWVNAQGGQRSLEQRRVGIARFYARQLGPIAKATQKYLGFWTDRKMVRDIVREGFGEDTQNPRAKEMLRLWLQNVAEPMREQVNGLGANIRKLAGWTIPQDHDWAKLARVGVEKWVGDVMTRLDRSAYLNEDGTQMSDGQLSDLLRRIHATISTDGASEGGAGRSGIAELGQHSRVLHFKDGDSYLDYHAQYGSKSLLETMISHVESMSKSIASLQQFGSQDRASFNRILDKAYSMDRLRDPTNGNKWIKNKQELQSQFKIASGRMGQVGNPRVAHAFQVMRSLIAFRALGGASISAITDSSNMMMVAHSWKIPALAQWGQWESKAWASAEHRQFMRSQGIGVEMINHAVSRFNEEVMGHGLAGNLANVTFRLTGLNFKDNVLRTATGGMLMDTVGRLANKYETLAKAHPDDVARITEAGTDERTWQVWRRAAQDEKTMLCPDTIMQLPDSALADLGGSPAQLRQDAAQHLIGVVSRDTDTVVPMPTDKARAKVEYTFGDLRGKPIGEILRSTLQFLSFPIAMFSNHWQRMMSYPTLGGRAAYTAMLLATSSILGAVSVQLKSLITGYNPQDMTSRKFIINPKFAGRAIAQGGALGLWGDLVLKPISTPYRAHLTDQAGPLISEMGNLYDLGHDAFKAGTDPNAKVNLGGDIVHEIRGNTPFASWWWTKAAFDHLIFQRLQEYYSPGYNERAQARSVKYFGSNAYWPPSAAASPAQIASGSMQGVQSPQAPNLKTALGGQQ